jgi:hypothetical protein
MIKKTYRRFVFLLSMFLITVALTTGSVPQAGECANGTCGTLLPIWTYYTDASKTVQCGFYNWCWNDQQGCVTEFKTSRREICWNCN